MTSNLANFLLAHFPDAKRYGKEWKAHCPAHDDRNPSLSIDEKIENGECKVVFICRSGCSQEAVIRAIGKRAKEMGRQLALSAPFPALATPQTESKPAPWNIPDKSIIAAYDYTSASGEVLYQNVRLVPPPDKDKDFKHRHPDGSGGWLFGRGGPATLYNLPEMLRADHVLLCEGEKDCNTAKNLGFVATTSGGSTSWKDSFATHFAGKHVVFIPDNDRAGREYASAVTAIVPDKAASFKVLELPNSKDLSEWVEKGGTNEALQALIDNAPEWHRRVEIKERSIVLSADTENSSYRPDRKPLPFPQKAIRGLFDEYIAAMQTATEASDAFHFATLWARIATALGRRMNFYLGLDLYPNVYLACFGPTGDRKTSATRNVLQLGSEFNHISGGGSAEGISDKLSTQTAGEGVLIYGEELSSILRPGKWDGATLLPFLTQCFDCPPKYEMAFRKQKIALLEPTPSLLAGTTPTWFWDDMNPKDFAGGFGNRIFYFAGMPKDLIALPKKPQLESVSHKIGMLSNLKPMAATFDAGAQILWEEYYRHEHQKKYQDPYSLQSTATRRMTSYVIKLAMAFSASETSFGQITRDHLEAAIAVGNYGEECVGELLSLRELAPSPRKELEKRIIDFVRSSPEGRASKRTICQRLHCDAETFNRTLDALVRAGQLYAQAGDRRDSVWVSVEPS
jgi:hypothetical protein